MPISEIAVAAAAKELGASAAMEAAKEVAQKTAVEAIQNRMEIQSTALEQQTLQDGFRVGEIGDSRLKDAPNRRIHETFAERDLSSRFTNDASESSTDETKILPNSDGSWSENRGESIWTPDGDVTPLRYNPDEKSWSQIMKDYDFNGIPYQDSLPDFSEVRVDQVEIKDFTEDRYANFSQADEALSSKWNEAGVEGKQWKPLDVKQYRQENHLTWHEQYDKKTMDLVPSEVHNNIPHSGGISAFKHLVA